MPLVRDRYTEFFASNKDFLMKNIGLCFQFSSSLNKVALIETSETAR